MRKKVISFIAAFLLVTMMSLSVQAEEISGGDGWSVTFDGNSMDSTFKNADIDDTIYRLQPGDTANMHLNLKNADSNQTDWYMSNQVLKSLEETQSVAEGGVYSYTLTYVAPDGTQDVLFSSDSIGGDLPEGQNGLRQATESMNQYFYLDRLNAGEQAEVHLSVHLEGETQGNGYQDTLAKLQMNFAVEKVTANPNPPSEPTPSQLNPTPHKPVKTGDQSRILWFSILTLFSGMVCMGLAIRKVRSCANKKGV